MDTTPLPVSDHRRSGWTLWREIYGTFVGVLPLIFAVLTLGYWVLTAINKHDLEIFYLQQADARHDAQLAQFRLDQNSVRSELLARMDKLGNQIETLQQTVARNSK